MFGGKNGADYWPLIAKRSRMLNAGVEVNDYGEGRTTAFQASGDREGRP